MAKLTRSNTRPGSAGRKAVYAREYRSRQSDRMIPPRYRSGHGDMPTSVVKRLERGEATSEDKRRYREQMEGYEERYGPAGTGRLPETKRATGTFRTRAQAEAFAEEESSIPEDYREVRKVGDRYAVYRKRAVRMKVRAA